MGVLAKIDRAVLAAYQAKGGLYWARPADCAGEALCASLSHRPKRRSGRSNRLAMMVTETTGGFPMQSGFLLICETKCWEMMHGLRSKVPA